MSSRQIVPRRGFRMEYREGTSVYIRYTRLLATTILVHELGGVLQEQDNLSMGVLQQARRIGI